MTSITARTLPKTATGLWLAALLLSGCTLPRPDHGPRVYDFGPGTLPAPAGRAEPRPPLEIGPTQASTALNGNAVLYRLGYADAQQLQPYALARWSMPPAQLIGQRLRARLSQHRAILAPGELSTASAPRSAASGPLQPPQLGLRLELEEFSQLFDTPGQSHGLLRLRATVTRRNQAGEALLAQRSFVVQQPAPTPDASGGVRALTAATDQAIGELEAWLDQVSTANPSP